MLKKIILIKLGGGLISDKAAVDKANIGVIDDISRQIKEIVDTDKNISLIMATGAGGYGHPVAKKYINNLKDGLPFIKKAVKEINNIVVSSLQKTGLNAISVEPSAITEYKNGKLIYLFNKLIFSWLESGIIPVFHADLVEDKKLGITILSMDRYLADLALHLRQKGFNIEKVVYAGTTDGVIGGDGKTIAKISPADFKNLEKIFFKGQGVDVSGGMKKKVEIAINLAKEGIKSQIIEGLKIKDVLLKNKSTGTEITSFKDQGSYLVS